MNLLEVSGVSRKEQEYYVVKGIRFTQQAFQKLAIAGATGSGKTTLLKMIAGLTEPTEGTILFNNERVKGPNERLLPGHASIAYLSQHFELRNHYRVNEILAMASKISETEALLIYEVCRIGHLLKRWTHQLSGGEKQRIALARLVVSSPQLLLLDEPYSNLDPFHKGILKSVVDDLSTELNITCILVSHEPIDTLSWADEILILKDGELIQKGSPEEIYKQPINEYAAALFGRYNLLNSTLVNEFSAYYNLETNGAKSFFRPEDFKLVKKGYGLEAIVNEVKFMGSFYEVAAEVDGNNIIIHANGNSISKGDVIYIGL